MENKPSYYSVIPASVRYDKRLTPNAKLLYGEITALCDKSGECWATNTYFSNLYKKSKTSISKWINQLIEYGYISSRIIYVANTKQIDRRYLSLIPIEEKFNRGIKEKLNTPIKEKLKDNTTRKSININNNIKDFEKFWDLYPKRNGRKIGKSECLEWWKKNSNGNIETILIAVKNYSESQNAKAGYVKDPIRFLRKELWRDWAVSVDTPRTPDQIREQILKGET